jgi:putative intracellular protease/amidase
MTSQPLQGKKIAVLLETEYVPAEIKAYQEQFGALGAQVDLMSRLWQQEKLTFVSDVDNYEGSLDKTRARLETIEVGIDFEKVDVNQYDAVLMAANYCSVRLRYFDPPAGTQISPEMVRSAPAVQFFAKAMRNPRIVKGALCHGLWLLTPTPELLAGRRVICHPVVLTDIVNAGATYVPSLADSTSPTPDRPAPGVVVDDDLVTGDSYKVAAEGSHPYIVAIKDAILRIAQSARETVTEISSRTGAARKRPDSRHILVVLSERGYWGEELIGPLEVFDREKYMVTFATPTGKRPRALPPSMDSNFIDPPLSRPVVSEEMARKTREIDDVSENRGAQSRRLDNPLSLAAIPPAGLGIPERPYWSHPSFVRAMEAYNQRLSRVVEELEPYDALLIVGGSGPIVDLVNNQRMHDLILAFYRAGKIVGAECYGVTCLAFARDPIERKSIIWGKHVTGHCLEYDYKDGTGFLGTDFNMGPPPYPLEYILRDATGPEGGYHGNFGKEISVIADRPFVTGRSTADSTATGEQLVLMLEDTSYSRYGWEDSRALSREMEATLSITAAA